MFAFPTVAVSEEDRRRHEALLRAAIAKAGLTLDQSAREAEMDSKQFARQLAMVEGSHKRLLMQPRSFWQWLAIGLAAYYGIPPEVKRAYQLARASGAARRMAKATLQTQRRKVG